MTVRLHFLLAGVLMCVLTLAACATSINRVLTDPSRYRDKEVKVSGRVEDSFSVGSRGAYRIVDDSAQLWVISDVGVPRVGARVTVRGTIREGFNLGNLGDRIKLPAGTRSGVVLVESSHSARD